MSFSKQLKDQVYQLLQEPTLDKFREFLHSETGEHNMIDFKQEWIEYPVLAKEILALANTKGGILIFGVAENDDKSFQIKGLSEVKDPVEISNGIKNFISPNLKYDVYSFVYDSSEYEALKNKKFQMLVVEDTPQYLPFFSKKESSGIKQDTIYVRRGTSCEIAKEEEVQSILNRRINYLHPLSGEPLQLDEHLKQLKTLYKEISKNHVYYKNGLTDGMASLLDALVTTISKGEKVVEPNPLYPDEEYEEFVSRMIREKKKKIERVLDLY